MLSRKYTTLTTNDPVTGPGCREQQAGALREGPSHEEGIEPGVRNTVSDHGIK